MESKLAEEEERNGFPTPNHFTERTKRSMNSSLKCTCQRETAKLPRRERLLSASIRTPPPAPKGAVKV